jgi:aromatic ring-cleaving dioxygenase
MEEEYNKITHIKGSKVTPHKQRMYKIGYGPNTFGLTSEDKLSTITPPIPGAVEYSHTRTIHYLNEDPFNEQERQSEED